MRIYYRRVCDDDAEVEIFMYNFSYIFTENEQHNIHLILEKDIRWGCSYHI